MAPSIETGKLPVPFPFVMYRSITEELGQKFSDSQADPILMSR